ncbi:MAG: aromatic amino acid ammonia-lyase [Bacteroidetes bacterium]|nr:aromatic amino acid ammonia-lyase [Bacteroidota bacterium]
MISIGGELLTDEVIRKIVLENEKIEIDPEALRRVEENHSFLLSFASDKIIYGINTGFGPMARYRIEEEDQIALQYNLIRSHASGAGAPIQDIYIRAGLLARLNSLLQAHSGIHPEVPVLICEFLNHEIYPVIPEHGGVGASGDLVQLSHMALALIGEGDVSWRGKRMPVHEVFAELGLTPVSMHIREGLALINGTSVMTGIGAVNVARARKLLRWSVWASSLINELVESYDDHFSEELNSYKKHPGQQYIAGMIRKFTAGSALIRSRADHLFNGCKKKNLLDDKVQEYYSIRCVPQILGPVHDTIQNAGKVVTDEFNSVNDNPVIDDGIGNVFHGGNFHGDYISLEMDKLRMAVTRLSMLSERQLNYFMNDKLNEKWPPFVNLGRLGLNLGMQGVQFTATSTVAENQTLSNSMYVHSIPNNNDNQDIVSMGTNAALLTSRVIENAFQVLSIQLMALIQAVDYLGNDQGLSPVSRKYYSELRALVPKFEKDTTKYREIEIIRDYLINHCISVS